jgi:acylphosphatase
MSTGEHPIARHVVVHGRVQGVFFRDSLRQEAERLGVRGWVRNAEDGTVEAWLEGRAGAVEELVGWTGHGPPEASVERLSVDERPHEGCERFEVR